MITYFVLWCYLLIQGMAQIHRSFAFSKRWGTTEWYQSIVLLVELRPWVWNRLGSPRILSSLFKKKINLVF
jgi:hypothetical protein